MKFWRLAALLGVMTLSRLAAAQATQLSIVAPFDVGLGTQFSMAVKAVDVNQNVDSNYTGTVFLSSNDTGATFSPLPPYTFTPADGGVHTFQVQLNSAGGRQIFASDTGNNLNGNTTVNVAVSGLNTTTTIGSSSNPSVYGQLVNFTITVQPNGPPPTGNVAYFDNGRFINTQAVNCCSGQATVATNQLAVGVHSLTAQYSGDNIYVASVSNPFSQTVNKTTTTVTVTAAPNPADAGVPGTLQATVGAPTGVCPSQIQCPNGTVTFFDGGSNLGTSSVDGNGNAFVFTTFAPAGSSHATTAPTTGFVIQNVTGTTPSATSITSTPNPANVGQQVTFTIAVTGAGSTPTGTVNLLDPTFGPGPFNSLTLDASGQASFSTSLPPGNHTITADYQGDATFMGSSGQVNQVVSASSKKPTTTSVGSSANPAVSGQSITFTA